MNNRRLTLPGGGAVDIPRPGSTDPLVVHDMKGAAGTGGGSLLPVVIGITAGAVLGGIVAFLVVRR